MHISKYRLRQIIMKELKDAVEEQLTGLSDPVLIDEGTFTDILKGLSEKINPKEEE